MKRASLRAWLRREPVPEKVKVRLEDGEEKEIHIPGDVRNRWKTVEASVNASNGVAVSLYDKKGVLLRAQDLEREPDEDEDAGDPVAKADKARSRDMKEWTGMLQAVMHEQNTSFDKGVAAAAQSQDSLVQLVDSMAAHFAAALTNIHNIVANQAILQQQHAEQSARQTQLIAELSSGDGSGKDDGIKQLLLASLLGGRAPQAPAAPNGSKKDKS